MALKKYKMHLVMANEFLTHKDKVVVFTISEKISVHRYKTLVSDVVENPLIRLIAERHSAYVEKSNLWYLSLKYYQMFDITYIYQKFLYGSKTLW